MLRTVTGVVNCVSVNIEVVLATVEELDVANLAQVIGRTSKLLTV